MGKRKEKLNLHAHKIRPLLGPVPGANDRKKSAFAAFLRVPKTAEEFIRVSVCHLLPRAWMLRGWAAWADRPGSHPARVEPECQTAF